MDREAEKKGVEFPRTVNIHDIEFASPSIAFGVADDGIILKITE